MGNTASFYQEIAGKAAYLFSEENSLLDSENIQSGWLDMAEYDKYQVEAFGSSANAGFTLTIESSSSAGGTGTTVTSNTSTTNEFFLTNLIARQRYIRFTWTNKSSTTVSDAYLAIKVFIGSSDKLSVFPVNIQPSDFSQAALVQSISRGQSPSGSYEAVGVNEAGAILTADFGTEVARGLYSGYDINTKFGRNPDIDTATTPEDIYNGGSLYTGFNATANEEISLSSADNNDRGSLVSSGTATGGSNTTLIDSGATFVTDGVAVGDIVLNDTQGIHGIITVVDSETQVTVFQMIDGIADDISNASGDSYRIATSIDTGAAVLKLKNILDENYVEQTDIYVILNGTTTVTTSGVNAMRCPTGRVVLAGSTGRNEGEITVTQATTTSNVFCVIPTFGATTIGCFTVPAGKDCIIKRVLASITRSSGAAGSATIALNVRMYGQAFTSEKVYELQTGAPVDDKQIGGIVLPPGTDVKGTVEAVSDNNTIAQINIEYFLIDR